MMLSMKSPTLLPLAVLGLIAFVVGGCGRQDSSPATGKSAGAGPMAADLAATFAREKDFYVFKTATDLPAGLKWENGSDLPEFADPTAKTGGTFNYFIQDFPRTTRVIGPDATGGIRQFLWDYVDMSATFEHPNISGRVYPGYAKEWAADPASRTMYYRIDEKAHWSDGAPLTTEDVAFSFYFYRSPHIREPWY